MASVLFAPAGQQFTLADAVADPRLTLQQTHQHMNQAPRYSHGMLPLGKMPGQQCTAHVHKRFQPQRRLTKTACQMCSTA
jgi:hypothetical protein